MCYTLSPRLVARLPNDPHCTHATVQASTSLSLLTWAIVPAQFIGDDGYANGDDGVNGNDDDCPVAVAVAAPAGANARYLAHLLLRAFLSCTSRVHARTGALVPSGALPIPPQPFVVLAPRVRQLFASGTAFSQAPLTTLAYVFTGAAEASGRAAWPSRARVRALALATRRVRVECAAAGGRTAAALLPSVIAALAAPGSTMTERAAAIDCVRVLAEAVPTAPAHCVDDSDTLTATPHAACAGPLSPAEVRELARALVAGTQASPSANPMLPQAFPSVLP